MLFLLDIIETLGRTEDSIIRKARRINIDTRKKEEDKSIKNWSYEEDQYLIANYGIIANTKLSEHIKRSPTSISKRAKRLNISNTLNRWEKEDELFLEEKWGIVSVEAIANTLNRSRSSILLKAWNMDLRQQATANGAYLTPPEVSSITGISLSTVYAYIKKDKIQYKKFRTGNKRRYQISPTSLLVFLEKYEMDWNTQFADIIQIKSYLSSYLIKSDRFTIKENIPEWLLNKIIRERNQFNKNVDYDTYPEKIMLA